MNTKPERKYVYVCSQELGTGKMDKFAS